MRPLILTLVMLALGPVAVAEEPTEQPAADTTLEATNQFLMQYIGNSGLTFVRNNNKHDAKAALAHVQRKYEYFRNKISSPEQFIELTASRSLISGRPYEVILPDGSHRPMEQWLLEALADYRTRPQEVQQDAAE